MTKKHCLSRRDLETACKVLRELAKYANEVVVDYLYNGFEVPHYYDTAVDAMREAEAFARVALGGHFDKDELEIVED